MANYKGKLYNLPFNMNTFYQMWGVTTPDEAKAKIEEQKQEAVAALNGREPANLEEQALSLVEKDIMKLLLKATPRSSGAGRVPSYHPSLSSDCR